MKSDQRRSWAPEDWKWTQMKGGDSFLKTGDIVYVGWRMRRRGRRANSTGCADDAALEQDSGAQASLMAVDNGTGEVLAMVGGRDYNLSQFNRATQAERQVGSSFKPYVYAAAVEAGAKPDDIIVDGPTTFSTPGGPYTPHNYEGDYKGPMTLLNAFAESRNIPALKLADRVGMKAVVDMVHRFGVTSNVPMFLPVAIGAAGLTLEEQVASYSVFPNDGIRLEPHCIRKVTTTDDMALQQPNAAVQVVLDVKTARTMMQLQAVTKFGTGAAAAQLNHPLGGKTGTTNDFTDAWFIGFSPSVTNGVWVGFDDPAQTLGNKETGAQAALPIWMSFMRKAIEGKPDEVFPADAVVKPVAATTTNAASASAAASGAGAGAKAATAPSSTPAKSAAAVPMKSAVTVKSAAPSAAKAAAATPAAKPSDASGGSSAAPAAHPAQSAPSTPQP